MNDFRGYIEVTEIDPRLLVQVAYSGSRPQGLGFLHHRPGGLSEDELNEIVKRSEGEYRKGEISLDYVNGRSMKFHVLCDRETGKKYIDLDWYDHSREDIKHLVRECGLPDVEARIAAAEAGKAEKAREWEALQEESARLFVSIALEHGGTVKSSEPPFKDYFRREDTDPIAKAWMYGRERAIERGWATRSQDWGVFTVTKAGRAIINA